MRNRKMTVTLRDDGFELNCNEGITDFEMIEVASSLLAECIVRSKEYKKTMDMFTTKLQIKLFQANCCESDGDDVNA